MEEYELYRELGMLDEVITYNVKDDGRFRDNLPFFGGKYILSRKGGEGDANKAVIDKLIEVGAYWLVGKSNIAIPIHGVQRLHHLPKHTAMVRINRSSRR